MAQVMANGIPIEVEDHGNKGDPVILLIMGFSVQLTFWPEDFVQSLVDAGYRVVRFDNRDIGLSHKFDGVKAPNPLWHLLVKRFLPSRRMAPYSLEDMAADAVGVLDALEIEKAHVIGVSMGGMISQILAADYPQRVQSLIPVMTSTNNPKLPRAEPHVQKALFAMAGKRPEGEDEAVAMSMRFFEIIGSKDAGRDLQEVEDIVRTAYRRSHYPAGPKRQMAAIIDTWDLRGWTRRLEAPALVIHGASDPLIPPACGEDVAANIKNAKLEIVDGMGHDLPPSLLDGITAKVLAHIGQNRG